MSVNVQFANELRRISGQNTTQAQIMLALGYTPANDTKFLAHAKMAVSTFLKQIENARITRFHLVSAATITILLINPKYLTTAQTH